MIWSEIASKTGFRLANIQVICSDQNEHRRRIEMRLGDIPRLTPLTWQAVLDHEYKACAEAPFCIDTALTSPVQAVLMVAEASVR